MKEKHRSSRSNSVIVYIVSFFMSLTLIFISTILVAGVTLFNDRDLKSHFSGTTYFSELNNEIVTRCKTIAAKSGIDYDAVSSVLTSNRIDSDFTVYFSSISGENPTAGRATVKEDALADEFYSSILAYDAEITESEKANARLIAEKMAKEYKDSIVAENFEGFIAFFENYQKINRYALFILIALYIYLTFVILSVNGKNNKHRLFRRFAVVAGSSGLTVLMFSLLMKISGVFEKIAFASTQREYNLLVGYFDEFLSLEAVAGCVLLVVCIVLLSLWYMSVTGKFKR